MLSDLQSKDIINLIDGRKIGSIIDVYIGEKGVIDELVVQKRRFLFFSSGELHPLSDYHHLIRSPSDNFQDFAGMCLFFQTVLSVHLYWLDMPFLV